MSTSATRPSSPQAVLADQLFPGQRRSWSNQPVEPWPISGEMTVPSGTGAWDMKSTGTGGDVVFAHAVPHSAPCAAESSDDHVPQRIDRGHLTITAETSPAPTASLGLETTEYPQLGHPQSRASSTVQRTESRGGTGHPSRTVATYLTFTSTTTRSDARPLTLCRLRTPTRKTASAALPARRPSRRSFGTDDDVHRRYNQSQGEGILLPGASSNCGHAGTKVSLKSHPIDITHPHTRLPQTFNVAYRYVRSRQDETHA